MKRRRGEEEGEEEGVEVEEAEDIQTESSGGDESTEKGELGALSTDLGAPGCPEAPPVSSPDPLQPCYLLWKPVTQVTQF